MTGAWSHSVFENRIKWSIKMKRWLNGWYGLKRDKKSQFVFNELMNDWLKMIDDRGEFTNLFNKKIIFYFSLLESSLWNHWERLEFRVNEGIYFSRNHSSTWWIFPFNTHANSSIQWKYLFSKQENGKWYLILKQLMIISLCAKF